MVDLLVNSVVVILHFLCIILYLNLRYGCCLLGRFMFVVWILLLMMFCCGLFNLCCLLGI